MLIIYYHIYYCTYVYINKCALYCIVCSQPNDIWVSLKAVDGNMSSAKTDQSKLNQQ